MDNTAPSIAQRVASATPAQRLPVPTTKSSWFAASGSLIGALAASSCCILPLVLFILGISGVWVGNLVQLKPYQPYFAAVAVSFLSYGYWGVYRSSTAACGDGQTCTRPLPTRVVMTALVLATVLLIAALSFDYVAPLFLT